MTRPRPHPSRRRTVCVSGPDGSGKTTVLAEVERLLVAEGWVVLRGYGYGCVMCRHLDRPTGVAGAAASAFAGDPVGGKTTSRGRGLAGLPPYLTALHGQVDAGELWIRLQVLGLRSRLSRQSTLVITDRGPLDGLAKYDPRPGSLLGRRLVALARRFDDVYLLDAPAAVLARRDAEHSEGELRLWRSLYERWSRVLASQGRPVIVLDTEEMTAEGLARRLSANADQGRSGGLA